MGLHLLSVDLKSCHFSVPASTGTRPLTSLWSTPLLLGLAASSLPADPLSVPHPRHLQVHGEGHSVASHPGWATWTQCDVAEFAAVAIVLIAGEMCHVFIVPLFSLEGSIQSKQFRFVWNVLEKKKHNYFLLSPGEKGHCMCSPSAEIDFKLVPYKLLHSLNIMF